METKREKGGGGERGEGEEGKGEKEGGGGRFLENQLIFKEK